ncbi:MAG TPA: hypothetical protein VG916_03235 [Gemmatimonadaceae bacterium]|nr:hypothetical protein [Gemmatimonadaceae bacterium]
MKPIAAVVTIVPLVLLNACAARQSETDRLMAAPSPALAPHANGGHVPPVADVAADRDEMLAVLDSMHAHFDREERRTTRLARVVVIGALVTGAAGAASPVFSNDNVVERKISQAAAAITGILAGIGTELQLTRKSESQRQCKATLYHAVSDVRLRYSSLTLPATDSAWNRYVAFKDSVDRAVRANCA